MLGDQYLVAPVLTDTDSREVYLPEGRWVEKATGRSFDSPKSGLTIKVAAKPGEIPVYLLQK